MENNQSIQPEQENDNLLTQSTGDVLFSRHALPIPQTILEGFERRKALSPFISFAKLRELLEFLEFVVITERLIVPICQLSEKSQQISSDRRRWMDIALFTRAGDLHLSRGDIFNKLSKNGILVEARLQSEYPTVDELVTRLMPTSKFLQSRHGTELFGKAVLKEAIEMLPKLPESEDLNKAREFLRQNLHFSAEGTRTRYADY